VEDELYRIALEALNNVTKHAKARQVTVSLEFTDESANLEISDDGVGFDPDAARRSGGMGLVGIQERVQRIRGVFGIESTLGGGTRLRVSVPHAGIGDQDS
jgi:signal transduction histidine kinase